MSSLFSSSRERRLWLLALVVVGAIYATLGLASTLVGVLADRGLIDSTFFLGFLVILAAIVLQGLRAWPRGVEIWVVVAIAAAMLLVFLRMTIPEERSHLIEYAVVALLVYEALTERARQGRRVPVPWLLAILATSLAGALDEGIQAVLPSRVFDVRDLGFNALAAVMAVVPSAMLGWVRRRRTAPGP